MLKFDSDTHTYTVGDKSIPSVTQILSAEGLINSNYASEWHMLRGQYLHEAVKYYLDGALDICSVDPVLQPYLSAFQKFLDDTQFKVDGYEVPMYHPIYQYCGTPDLWGDLNGKKIVIDLKTGAVANWHSIQISAYYELLKINKIAVKGGTILYLQDNGKYRLLSMSTSELNRGLSVFLSCLTVHSWKKENL